MIPSTISFRSIVVDLFAVEKRFFQFSMGSRKNGPILAYFLLLESSELLVLGISRSQQEENSRIGIARDFGSNHLFAQRKFPSQRSEHVLTTSCLVVMIYSSVTLRPIIIDLFAVEQCFVQLFGTGVVCDFTII